MLSEPIKNRGWVIAFAGLAINLALGVLYSWSVFKDTIYQSIKMGGEGAFTWNEASLNDPYAACILVITFSIVLGGKIQDKKGPRLTAFIGGILVMLGFLLVSFTNSHAIWVLGFGLLIGTGIGFGYSAATPPALKWFPASKTGLIAGIVVSGFGLAPVYIAPLTTFLVKSYGLHNTMLIYSILFGIIVCGSALLLKNPPAGYIPQDTKAKNRDLSKTDYVSKDFKTSEMIRTPTFYLIWFIFFISSGAGLMVISSISGIAENSMGEAAFIAVAIMAIGNASGRIIAGIVSDKIGRILTLFIILVFQSILMFVAIPGTGNAASALIIVTLATFIGFNYGTNLSIFPSFAKGLWGMKNFGINYGITMTAWGLGGSIFSRVSQTLFANSGSYHLSFIIAGLCLIFCAFLTIVLKRVQLAPLKVKSI